MKNNSNSDFDISKQMFPNLSKIDDNTIMDYLFINKERFENHYLAEEIFGEALERKQKYFKNNILRPIVLEVIKEK